MKIKLIILVFLLIFDLSFSNEKESYERLMGALSEYSSFLGTDENRLYDLINSPQNSSFIKKYSVASNKYLDDFTQRPELIVDDEIKLPDSLINVFPAKFSNNETELFCNLINSSVIYELKGSSLKKIWEGDTDAFSGVGSIDLEGDGKYEILAFSDNNIYSFMRSKKGVVFYQKYQNYFGIISIFQSNNRLYGIIRRISNDISKKSGVFLTELEWIHPGFGIKREISELNTEMAFEYGNDLYIINNLEKSHGLISIYSMDGKNGLKFKENMMIDSKKNIAGLCPIDNAEEFIVFFNDEITRARRSSSKTVRLSTHGVYSETLKKGFKIGDSILALTFSNRLFFYKLKKQSIPMFK